MQILLFGNSFLKLNTFFFNVLFHSDMKHMISILDIVVKWEVHVPYSYRARFSEVLEKVLWRQKAYLKDINHIDN